MKVVKTEEEKKTSVNFAKKYFVQIKNNHKNGNKRPTCWDEFA